MGKPARSLPLSTGRVAFTRNFAFLVGGVAITALTAQRKLWMRYESWCASARRHCRRSEPQWAGDGKGKPLDAGTRDVTPQLSRHPSV
jgi:hypothetical protein